MKKIAFLILLIGLSSANLSILDPTFISFGLKGSYYDTQNYQVFISGEKYAIYNKITSEWRTYNENQCTGTDKGNFYCFKNVSNSDGTGNLTAVNKINIWTKRVLNAFVIPYPCSYFQTYADHIAVFSFTKSGYIVNILNGDTGINTCSLNLGPNKYNSFAYHQNEAYFSNSVCFGENCTVLYYNCNSGQNITFPLPYTTFIQLKLFLFANQSSIVPVMFSYQQASYYILGNGNETYPLGYVKTIQQVNHSSIVIAFNTSVLSLYTLNFNTLQFEVQNSLQMPTIVSISVSPIGPNNIILVRSSYNTYSSFLVNSTTMAIVDQKIPFSSYNFNNGSSFGLYSDAYLISTNGTFYLNFLNKALLNPYQNHSLLNAIELNNGSCNLYTFNLLENEITNIS